MLNSVLYRKGAIKKKVPYLLILRYYWKTLLGTCGAWFLYGEHHSLPLSISVILSSEMRLMLADFVTFPNGVFSGTILSSVVPDSSILKTAEWQLLLGVIALPGVFIGAYLCDRIGRKNTMMLGFSGFLVFGLIVGCAYDRITKIVPLFVIFYGLMQSSGNLGPGDMLGLLSSESYATAVRGTCYGFSAALGKTGAAVGTQPTWASGGPSSSPPSVAWRASWSRISCSRMSRARISGIRMSGFGRILWRMAGRGRWGRGSIKLPWE
jgi:MFS family permease